MRMIYVWEAVKSLGRASPESVLRSVVRRIGSEGDLSALKRSIYRDLKMLADSGDLFVEYHSPDGTKLEPGDEENHKNLRVEYFVPGVDSIHGGGRLESLGGVLITSRHRPLKWSVHDLADGIVAGTFALTFLTAPGLWISVCVGQDDRPFKLVIARRPEKGEPLPAIAQLEEAFGLRMALLALSEKSISRIGGDRNGHAVLEVGRDLDGFLLRDLGSSTGVFSANASAEDLAGVREVASGEQTLTQTTNPLHQVRDWKKVETATQVTIPAFVRFGDLTTIFWRMD